MNLPINLMDVALLGIRAHEGAYRKYTDAPYIAHPIRVASAAYKHGMSREAVAAGVLHDTLEDTAISEADIEAVAGPSVLALVKELTNPSKLPEHCRKPRAVRKTIDRDHLRVVSDDAKRLKLIDRTDNLLEMTDAPDDFKKLYAFESKQLMEAIEGVDAQLEAQLRTAIASVEESVQEQ